MSLARHYRRCEHGARCMVPCPGCETVRKPTALAPVKAAIKGALLAYSTPDGVFQSVHTEDEDMLEEAAKDVVRVDSARQRVATLEAGLRHVLHVLNDKQENGRPQPASIRAGVARIAAEKALEGDTMALDDLLADAERAAGREKSDACDLLMAALIIALVRRPEDPRTAGCWPTSMTPASNSRDSRARCRHKPASTPGALPYG